jgi:hypothetical protein
MWPQTPTWYDCKRKNPTCNIASDCSGFTTTIPAYYQIHTHFIATRLSQLSILVGSSLTDTTLIRGTHVDEDIIIHLCQREYTGHNLTKV